MFVEVLLSWHTIVNGKQKEAIKVISQFDSPKPRCCVMEQDQPDEAAIELVPVCEADRTKENAKAERQIRAARQLLDFEKIQVEASKREDLLLSDFQWQIGIRHWFVFTALVSVSCLAYSRLGIELAIPICLIALLATGYFYVDDWQRQIDRSIAEKERQWRDKYSERRNQE